MTELPRPAAILWDWDNTLIDGWAGVTASLNAVFDAFDRPRWTVTDTRERARLSLRDSFSQAFGDEWPRAASLFRETMRREHLAHLTPLVGSAAALAAGRRWPQGVVSNKQGTFVRREVAHLGWDDFFNVVVGAGDAEADKPSAAPLLHALSRIGIAAGPLVWYVGDTAIDMLAARAARCTAVLLGDAAHDGGLMSLENRGAAPDLHFADAQALETQLRALADHGGPANLPRLMSGEPPSD